MSITDYLLNGLLVAVVIRQVRGRRLTALSLLWPVGLVVLIGHSYIHGFPLAGNDAWLTVGGPLAGAVLGIGNGVLTRVRPGADGIPWAKAGVAAAGLWVLGTGARLGFEIFATHGGSGSIAHFSATHDITTAAAWTTGLVLMALAEVVGRTAVLAWKGYGGQRVGAAQEWNGFAEGGSGMMEIRETAGP